MGGRWMRLGAAMLSAFAVGCGGGAPREVADRFVEELYVDHDAEAAIALTQGSARDRVAQAVRLGRTERGEYAVSFLGEPSLSRDSASYVYRVVPVDQAVPDARDTLHVAVTVRDAGDGWRVTSFAETDGPPPG